MILQRVGNIALASETNAFIVLFRILNNKKQTINLKQSYLEIIQKRLFVFLVVGSPAQANYAHNTIKLIELYSKIVQNKQFNTLNFPSPINATSPHINKIFVVRNKLRILYNPISLSTQQKEHSIAQIISNPKSISILANDHSRKQTIKQVIERIKANREQTISVITLIFLFIYAIFYYSIKFMMQPRELRIAIKMQQFVNLSETVLDSLKYMQSRAVI
ncbi:hypothetical protein FGO68_gene12528 [Halteria grandinella]|uniref:Uncharacterized protein n=1 Tax=Halteria grandinella TaxID=5974 RepID=A0A8J8NGG5_HALGN|nr:hypothetical protein FGO68_gene12528 [Halteria grandinella]